MRAKLEWLREWPSEMGIRQNFDKFDGLGSWRRPQPPLTHRSTRATTRHKLLPWKSAAAARSAMSAASTERAPASAASASSASASAASAPSPSPPMYRVDAATSSLAFPRPLRPAPTFYPTEAEFADPIAYVQSIRHIGEKTGTETSKLTQKQRGGDRDDQRDRGALMQPHSSAIAPLSGSCRDAGICKIVPPPSWSHNHTH